MRYLLSDAELSFRNAFDWLFFLPTSYEAILIGAGCVGNICVQASGTNE